MSISSVCHWVTPLKGFQLSLEYRPGSAYYMTVYPMTKDSPVSSCVSLNIMFGSRQTLLECSRKSAKKQQEAIVLFEQKVKEFISSHPVEETEVPEIKPGDRFLGDEGTSLLVLMPAFGSSYHCQNQKSGNDCVISYAILVQLERIDPLSPDELQPIVDALLAKWEEEKRKKEEEKRKREESIAKGKAIVPSWAKSLLVAEFTENRSDSMTDYWNPNVVVEQIPLCFSTYDRNNVPEMKKASRLIEQTEHLSNGEYDDWKGTLKERKHDTSGWQISKRRLDANMFALIGEKGLPEATSAPQESVSAIVVIRRNEDHDGIELVFESKPSSETIEYLKKPLGFRWSSRQKLWYAKYTEERMSAVTSFLA